MHTSSHSWPPGENDVTCCSTSTHAQACLLPAAVGMCAALQTYAASLHHPLHAALAVGNLRITSGFCSHVALGGDGAKLTCVGWRAASALPRLACCTIIMGI